MPNFMKPLYVFAVKRTLSSRLSFLKSLIYFKYSQYFKTLPVAIVFLLVSGCAHKATINGQLGFSDSRRIVIVGEHVSNDIASFYEKKYDALVWFTPPQGQIQDTFSGIMRGVRPSYAMQALVAELKSINYTIGSWEIIVPKIAEAYVAATLKHMPTGSLSKARGMIILIDSPANKEIEAQIKRVSKGSFFVSCEFQQ